MTFDKELVLLIFRGLRDDVAEFKHEGFNHDDFCNCAEYLAHHGYITIEDTSTYGQRDVMPMKITIIGRQALEELESPLPEKPRIGFIC